MIFTKIYYLYVKILYVHPPYLYKIEDYDVFVAVLMGSNDPCNIIKDSILYSNKLLYEFFII